MSDPATFVPATTWQNLSSGGVQVTPLLTVPNATYLAPASGQNGLTGTADREVIYLAGTATRLDGGQQFLLWDAASTTPAAGTSVYNPWAVVGTPGRWKSATPGAISGLLANGVVYYDGTKFATNTRFQYNVTSVSLFGQLIVDRNTVAPPILDAQAPIAVAGADASPAYVWMFSAGVSTGTGMIGLASRGTLAAPTASQDGDFLTGHSGGGYGATTWKWATGGFSVFALGNWTDTQQGTRLTLSTTAQAAAAPSVVRADLRQGLMLTSGAGTAPTGGDPGPGSLNLFGTLQFNGTAIAGNVPATATNDEPATGRVGETLRNTATAVALVTGTPKTIVSQVLTAGDWDVWGSVSFNPAGTTTVSGVIAASHTVDNTFPADPDESYGGFFGSFTTGVRARQLVGQKRYKVTGTQTVFIVGQGSFATSTMTADGVIVCRRRR